MKFDTGLIVVIAAALIFYLRLIILQQQRVRRLARPVEPAGKKKKHAAPPPSFSQRYSIVSRRPADWVVAGVGAAAIFVGILLYNRLLPLPAVQSFWWLPTAAGILLFSWGFR